MKFFSTEFFTRISCSRLRIPRWSRIRAQNRAELSGSHRKFRPENQQISAGFSMIWLSNFQLQQIPKSLNRKSLTVQQDIRIQDSAAADRTYFTVLRWFSRPIQFFRNPEKNSINWYLDWSDWDLLFFPNWARSSRISRRISTMNVECIHDCTLYSNTL